MRVKLIDNEDKTIATLMFTGRPHSFNVGDLVTVEDKGCYKIQSLHYYIEKESFSQFDYVEECLVKCLKE